MSRVHSSNSSFDRELCKFIPLSKQNLLTDLELKPFLSGNLSFSNKLTSESVFLWVVIRSFMYSALKSLIFGKVLRGKYEFPASSFPEKCSVGGEGGGQEQKKNSHGGRGSGERALGAKNYRANGPLPLPIPIWHFRVFFIKNNENQKLTSIFNFWFLTKIEWTNHTRTHHTN